MQLDFRQGIVSYQQLPKYIQLDGNSVSLDASVNPVVIAFSHGTANYLYTELVSVKDAWVGPFDVTNSYWLYWDIDLITGKRSFGYTRFIPLFGNSYPTNPEVNQHYFYIPDMKMYYWNGQTWVECVRVFTGSLIAGVLTGISVGTQVNGTSSNVIGTILFDIYGNPLKKYIDTFFVFLTSVDVIPPANTNLDSVDLSQLNISGITNSYIPKFYCVISGGSDSFNNIIISKASYMNINNAAFAITTDNMNAGDVKQLITHGFLQDTSFNWQCPLLTPLFVGGDGEITVNVNSLFSIQKIGYVVNVNTIYIDIDRQILLS